MRRVLSELRESADVRAVLGDAVRPEPAWYLNGSPWVHGSVRHDAPFFRFLFPPIAPTPILFYFYFLFFLPRVGAWKKNEDGVWASVKWGKTEKAKKSLW